MRAKTPGPSRTGLASLAERLARVFREPVPAVPDGVRGGHNQGEMLSTEVVGRLTELSALQANWDGYGAPAPTPWTLAIARESLHLIAGAFPWALDELFLAPAVDGGMRLEWMVDSGRELMVAIPPEPSGQVEFYRSDEARHFEEDGHEADLAKLPEMLNWLVAA